MYVITLAAKLALALTFIAAGSAKLADTGGFASTVRLFIPGPIRRAGSRPAARLVIAIELATGYASLSVPRAGWLNWVVLGVAVGFVAVSVIGYARYRNRSCNCFGGLSQRRFNSAGIMRSVLIAAAAGLATLPGTPASAVTLSGGEVALLLIVALLAGCGTYCAAKAVAAVYRAQSPT